MVRKTLVLRNLSVALYDQNPAVLNQRAPNEMREKITIRDIPLSYSNEEVEKYLEDKGVSVKSPVMYAKERDPSGRLTEYKNGDRYVYAVYPVLPLLPRFDTIGSRRCRIFHKGQFESNCKACNNRGHKAGDDTCPARNDEDNITAFKAHTHILSNCANVDMGYNEMQFSSAQQIFEWEKAKYMERDELADLVLRSVHAGIAMRLTRNAFVMDTSDIAEWEGNSIELMRYIIDEKAKQCEAYRDALVGTGDKIIAAAIPDLFWGTGLDPSQSAATLPKYWPGHNMLGAIMMELREQLQPEDPGASGDEVKDDPMTDQHGGTVAVDIAATASSADGDGGEGASQDVSQDSPTTESSLDDEQSAGNILPTEPSADKPTTTDSDRSRPRQKELTARTNSDGRTRSFPGRQVNRRTDSSKRQVAKAAQKAQKNTSQSSITEFINGKRKHLTGSPTDAQTLKAAKPNQAAADNSIT